MTQAPLTPSFKERLESGGPPAAEDKPARRKAAPTSDTLPAVAEAPLPPAVVSPEETGLVGQFDERDWVIPTLYIVQPTSTEFPDAAPGMLAMRDGRWWPELRFVPLRIAATRAYWPKDIGEGRQPLCASNDRIYGRPFGDFEPYPNPTPGRSALDTQMMWPVCARCPHRLDEPWELEEGCFRGFAALLALPDLDEEVVILRIKGTSAGPWGRRVLGHFRPRPSKKVVPVWTKVFNLSTEQGDKTKGVFFVLSPALEGSTADPAFYAELAASLVTVQVGATEEGLPIEEEGVAEEEMFGEPE